MIIKRKIEIAVISDVHLGTNNCKAKKLLSYLNNIEPKKLILNGDIIDTWQFNEHYFPKQHLKVIKKIMDMAAAGVEVIYITGNHDDILRKFSGTNIGNISIVDKKVLEIDGKKAWIFHGDAFDVSTKNTRWLAKMGRFGYRLLFFINRCYNWLLLQLGKEKFSKSETIKNNRKKGTKFIRTFEKVISNLAIENGYDYVVCGHIHHPKMELKETKNGQTLYLNSGDWVEHFTALEYQFKRWKLYHYNKDKLAPFYIDEDMKDLEMKDLIAAITIIKQQKQL